MCEFGADSVSSYERMIHQIRLHTLFMHTEAMPRTREDLDATVGR
ncbi:hypothetical protein VTO73DRAFT_6689 [Trametes versicolor]